MFYLSIYAVVTNPDILILSHKPSYFNIEHLFNPKRRLLRNALMAKLSFSSETSIKKPQNHIECQIQKTALIFVETQKLIQNRMETTNHKSSIPFNTSFNICFATGCCRMLQDVGTCVTALGCSVNCDEVLVYSPQSVVPNLYYHSSASKKIAV